MKPQQKPKVEMKPDLIIQIHDQKFTIPDLDWTPEQLEYLKYLIGKLNGIFGEFGELKDGTTTETKG